MKKLILWTAITFCGTTTPFYAQAFDGLSANIAVTNNYLWRGVTQTQDSAAVSGGIDYDFNNGFSVGTWASNVEFDDDSHTEVDLYANYGFDLGGATLDLGYIYYGYPDADDSDFSEVNLTLSWNVLSIGVSTLADSDWQSDFGDDTYIEANLAFELTNGIELGFHLGSYDFDSGTDYQDYNVSLAKNGFSFMVSKVSENSMDDDIKVVISYSMDIDF